MYLEDMITSMNRILDYLNGYDYNGFLNDQKTIDAVTRNFEIIGEAANSIPQQVKINYPEVPWQAMYGLRNYASHEYFGLDLSTLWEIAQNSLPENKRQIERIITDLKN
ncbi:MAG: DUF86 domain-containing protein [Bacteroidia bacterium]